MKRRDFITRLGGAAAVAARGERTTGWADAARRRAHDVLSSTTRKHRSASERFCKDCSVLGWAVGNNLRIDARWAAADPDRHSQLCCGIGRRSRPTSYIPALAFSTIRPLLDATRAVPVVFTKSCRPGRCRPGGEFGPAGRERHRVHDDRIWHRR